MTLSGDSCYINFSPGVSQLVSRLGRTKVRKRDVIQSNVQQTGVQREEAHKNGKHGEGKLEALAPYIGKMAKKKTCLQLVQAYADFVTE